MAHTRYNNPRDIKVVIDGYPLAELMELKIDTSIDEYGPFISDYKIYQRSGRTRIELRTIHNIELAFDVTDKTLVGNSGYTCVTNEDATTVYVYGPLRQLIPSLFVDKDLLPWQLAYLEHNHAAKYLRYQLWRDDEYFSNEWAHNFEKGYDAGMNAGMEKGKSEGYAQGRKDEINEQKRTKQQSRRK